MSVYACVFGSIGFLHDSRGNPPDPCVDFCQNRFHIFVLEFLLNAG